MNEKDAQISFLLKQVEDLTADNERLKQMLDDKSKKTPKAAGVTGESSAEQKLFTVRQFSEKHKAFPEGGLRFIIFNEATNGAKDAGAIIRAGRKVLINEDNFFKWISSRNTKP